MERPRPSARRSRHRAHCRSQSPALRRRRRRRPFLRYRALCPDGRTPPCPPSRILRLPGRWIHTPTEVHCTRRCPRYTTAQPQGKALLRPRLSRRRSRHRCCCRVRGRVSPPWRHTRAILQDTLPGPRAHAPTPTKQPPSSSMLPPSPRITGPPSALGSANCSSVWPSQSSSRPLHTSGDAITVQRENAVPPSPASQVRVPRPAQQACVAPTLEQPQPSLAVPSQSSSAPSASQTSVAAGLVDCHRNRSWRRRSRQVRRRRCASRCSHRNRHRPGRRKR